MCGVCGASLNFPFLKLRHLEYLARIVFYSDTFLKKKKFFFLNLGEITERELSSPGLLMSLQE